MLSVDRSDGVCSVLIHVSRTPVIWWVFSDETVNGLAQQVSVPGVASVLLNQIADKPARARMPALPPHVDLLFQPSVGQRCIERFARSCYGLIPERIELLGRVVSGRTKLPIGANHVPVD